jgi:pyrimidine deaminase RibD-like protein
MTGRAEHRGTEGTAETEGTQEMEATEETAGLSANCPESLTQSTAGAALCTLWPCQHRQRRHPCRDQGNPCGNPWASIAPAQLSCIRALK